ncbi:MAG: SpoIIE family protein phosphatase [Treponema sp.]|nr:SpoIIE family protein phosphatase [Treponema sp.]
MMKLRGYCLLSVLFIFALPQAIHAQTVFFWEQPGVFSPAQGSFPFTASSDDFSIAVWQESVSGTIAGPDGYGDGSINIALAVKMAGQPWEHRGIIGGPYIYSGMEPSILSAVIDGRNRILIAAAATTTQTEILISEDMGLTFERHLLDSGAESSLSPQISVASDGTYLLFVTRGREDSFSVFFSRSVDGRSWEPFQPLIADMGLQLNFLPSHVAFQGRDYVVFQSFTAGVGGVNLFQIYVKVAEDAGLTWGLPRLFTNFQYSFMNLLASAGSFDNQRPHISVQGDSLFLVWERRYRIGTPHIYAARMGAEGAIVGLPERINTVTTHANNPIAINYRGQTKIFWFDNRIGFNRVFMAQRMGLMWEETELSRGVGMGDAFARPIVDAEDGLYVFWQHTTAQGAARIYLISPDTTVTPVQITAHNFIPGRRTSGDRVQLSWNIPYDPSGIMGFSWTWSQDEHLQPAERVVTYNIHETPSLDLFADEDGEWFFTVMAHDFAGNWSPTSRIIFFRDTTPPPAASIIHPGMDAGGYLLSNTFQIHWEPPYAPDLAGYTWRLEYLGAAWAFSGMDDDQFAAAVEERFPVTEIWIPTIQGTNTFVSHVNQDDGVWRFVVRAIDEAGNVGPQTSLVFRTNKYIPSTFITWVDSIRNLYGFYDVSIFGRGFSRDGNVSRVFLDRDGQPPFDREFFLGQGDYAIVSDREIRGLVVEGLEPGFYRLGVEHPVRGIYFTGPILAITETGTVKFGDFSGVWRPSWLIRDDHRISFNTATVVLVSILILCLLGLLVSARGIGQTITEGAVLRLNAAALISGELMTSEKKKRMIKIKRRGIGLRLKLACFTMALIFAVVIMISAPLYVMMTRNQQETLIQGLWDRSMVLLEGVTTGARAHLPLQSVLDLGLLPNQMHAIPEAQYITITGHNPAATIFDDQVWATNDPDILQKIDTQTFQPGVSRIRDALSPQLEIISQELNEQARLEIGNMSDTIASLTQEALGLALRTDIEGVQRLSAIQSQITGLQTRLSEHLADLSRNIGSYPHFSVENFVVPPDNRFLFFKPIMFRQGTEGVYFRGLVRMEVSVTPILDEIESGQDAIIRVIALFALVAQIAGVVGALLLSVLIIRPVGQLVRHIEIIRDTEDKTKLAGVDIHLKSKDELAILGDTINDMTRGLVKAAAAAADLSLGKEIQKKFIPLELDREGNKLSYGSKDTERLSFFGYYEGAKGVSGDYFNYLDLDGRYYAFIKCDVAGKGIPAALIMIQVATLFLGFFRRWKATEKGMRIEDLVYQINEFIETMGFKGRFAAFTLCLYDSHTGQARFCNAGDNIVNIFDASEGRLKTITLPETPATGVIPNFLVESKGGYKVQTITLDHGDILLLYTDGIEESKRKFRDPAFQDILCEAGTKDTPHENHIVGQADEEMGPERVQEIINAVMNKKMYSLQKWHNPEGDGRVLQFDFSSCSGTAEDVIMAMVSVEKMFRCYKNPADSQDSRVLVEKTVDAFLKEHFLQYRHYCLFTEETPGNPAYMYYTHVNEDEQYDDLTILGIKRK